ncbi:TPA: alpha/beta hydrolase [Pseudomonas aeruginosa]|uniref:alpha/beta hydrolase n=1 Tax=Pseudomonas aeruginosa TaxID=287 RepID=UPI00071E59C9|nr:alpha/beta hydrolase [Pseudomonas aeruginosa]KSP56498.1 alpha/beta hydrolase [Pseudomonas aeruginosa]MEE3527947.1 alpha/beta hydrolase [Pseudomonas aeruginosa]NBK31115.1 alpha/beta hydrolase [Pseudomonas aeruginosa]NBY87800.1 alpha/beta hydrolase [Pseudomonas aeruginosa]NPX05850.1 alpha/beta hydrolase [Pseudomonas aeruginosa]
MTTPKHVTYRNLGWDSAADLYLPPGFDEGKQYPAIVSTHPIGSCKEQTSGNIYARQLAQAGFIVLAFDASFQGASGGEPRFMEDPAIRVSDIRFAIDYLVSLPYVDAQRIGAIGVCGGGAYTINAAMTDYRIKALTSITGVNFGRLMREGFSQFDPVGSLQAMAAQRTAEAKGEARHVINYLPDSVEAGKQAGIGDIDVLEATDYYKSARGRQPNGATSGLFSFNSAAMAWDAFAHAETLLIQPVLVVIGDKPGGFGAYRDGWEIYGRATSKAKQIFVAEGWSHYDLYDQPEPVALAMAQIVPFFKQHL